MTSVVSQPTGIAAHPNTGLQRFYTLWAKSSHLTLQLHDVAVAEKKRELADCHAQV